jgi:hypothetical protein
MKVEGLTNAPHMLVLCATGNSSYLNLAQHSHEYDAAGTSLEALYGDSAVWINYHAGGYGSGGRRSAAAMWRSGFGRRR